MKKSQLMDLEREKQEAERIERERIKSLERKEAERINEIKIIQKQKAFE
jgi:plasmid rolling circle replication initiator protein Rep